MYAFHSSEDHLMNLSHPKAAHMTGKSDFKPGSYSIVTPGNHRHRCRCESFQYKVMPKDWLTRMASPMEIARSDAAHVSFSVIRGTLSLSASVHEPRKTV